MASPHIVVDGSNIATEGRSAPSLAQLEQAVAELKREHPGAEVTVIVDATFAHRIDPSELERFEKAALAGEYVHPPAGAIGRGDAFLLRVAEKVDATVLSNDSFQEFHGEHPWLFDRGRLLGATPVPGVGWIFSPRTPVRGPASRQAVREVERARRQLTKAIKEATKEAVTPLRARRGATPKVGDRGITPSQAALAPEPRRLASPAAVNDPLTFVSFIAEHPLGAEVVGRVETYTSHGAVVMVGSTQCYIPLTNLAEPPPRSAREVLKRGEDVTFVVHALDPQRRGVELALPGVGAVSGVPSEEMIAAEVRMARKRQPAAKKVGGLAGRSFAAGRSAGPREGRQEGGERCEGDGCAGCCGCCGGAGRSGRLRVDAGRRRLRLRRRRTGGGRRAPAPVRNTRNGRQGGVTSGGRPRTGGGERAPAPARNTQNGDGLPRRRRPPTKAGRMAKRRPPPRRPHPPRRPAAPPAARRSTKAAKATKATRAAKVVGTASTTKATGARKATKATKSQKDPRPARPTKATASPGSTTATGAVGRRRPATLPEIGRTLQGELSSGSPPLEAG